MRLKNKNLQKLLTNIMPVFLYYKNINQEICEKYVDIQFKKKTQTSKMSI